MAKKPTVHLNQGKLYTWCGRKRSTVSSTDDRAKVTCKTCKAARSKRTLFQLKG